MKILILFILSVILLCSQCSATSRRSGGDNNKNNAKENENTGFWASRGKRNDGYGLIRCGWIRSPDDTDEELNWPPRLDESVVPEQSLETRFKRSAGYPVIRDIEIPTQFQPHNLPAWGWGGEREMAIPTGRIMGNSDFVNRQLAWLRLIGKRNAEKDSNSANNNNGGNTNTDSSSVPFWAARG